MTYRYHKLALDLFCGQGGVVKGLHNAGFNVFGVDNKPMPRYPFTFIQADALEFLETQLNYYGFDSSISLISASPPCMRYSKGTRNKNKAKHPDLIAPVRELLKATGRPYVIENVPGAPLIDPVELCGCMFGLQAKYRGQKFQIYRPRLFEASFKIFQPEHREHIYPALPVMGHGQGQEFINRWGWEVPSAIRSAAMGTEWMTRDGTSQSIPPAMAEHVGHYAMAHLTMEQRYQEAA